MSNLSQKGAREFIAKVREDNGGISQEDRKFLEANVPAALRALQSTRKQLAQSIKIVVDNLYSKETRFLYELIQNAEDNSYSIATAAAEEPFLAFKLYPDRIIIDSNEDGFSESNIRAICSVGNSTKDPGAGYIGEKGIGFKSVFKIAQKVHIQSGPFSFAFSHTREDDDDGLGMITPYYEDSGELPMGVRTRMTLTLLDSTNFEERATELRDVPDTFLMFLSQLQRLSIELYPPGNAATFTQYSKRETKENGLYTTFLAQSLRNDREDSTSEQKYYTMKRDLHDLPLDAARKDKKGNHINQATVILAFPVDEHDEPALKQQYTYAFLPLRQVGFQFLIQADFITQANREDVVHSERNRAVLKGVAKAFVDAVVKFCTHPSLRYQWMRYLPENFITDGFWSTLWTLMHDKLKQTPLLEPWSGNGLYKPPDLEKLSENFIAEDRSPLLPDLEGAEIYLSPKYSEADFQLLARLGTTVLQWRNFIDRLDADLRIPHGSNWRSMEENADWRTRICKLLSSIFTENLPSQQKRLRRLALIPLCDGRWVSSDSGTKIYFPKTDDTPIPVDLGLDLVNPMAAENIAWADLLSASGVMSCPRDAVIGSINKRYNATNLENFEVLNAVAHIRYLYWFLSKDQPSLASQIRLINQHGALLKKDQYLYFRDEGDDYSPSKLFEQNAQLPGHPVHYLHEGYLKAVDPEAIHNGRSWMRWLEEIAGVRRIPELSAKGHGLSKEFQYIVDHRSNMLLGTLKRGWAFYRLQINDSVKEELQSRPVLLENGTKTLLHRTFLPLPSLKQIAEDLRIANACPFVAVSELLRDEEKFEWIFVKELRVGIEENLDFYLSALEKFKTINTALNTIPARERLTRIYRNIQLKCSESPDHVRDVFMHPLIWIQPSNRIKSTWLSTADCVWDGPQWLKSKQCLKLKENIEFEHLFKVSLGIPDASQKHVLDDLDMLKSYGGETPYQVTSLKGAISSNSIVNYQSITFMKEFETQSFEELRLKDYESKVFAGHETGSIIEEAEKRYDYLLQKHSSLTNDQNPESRKTLLSTFESSGLVYIPKENAWYPPSQCVWVESSVKIPEKASIADAYPLKKAFFTTVLKVPEPTVEMYVDSLEAEAKGKASVAQIKETMTLICGLGVGEVDLSNLIEANVLPVKLANGVAIFASASSKDKIVDFAIMENTIHWDAFKGKIAVLDFSLEEIRDTRPLLLAMGLGERFSSKLVKEVTDVRGGTQHHEMTKNLRVKSQAITRCAFHFASLNKRQDAASLYRKFKRAKVYMSDSIRRSLRITQHGRSIEGTSRRSNFHFGETEGALRLYLPNDEVERDVCFESDLPCRLCSFLCVDDPTAPGVIGGVFRKDNPAVIDRILENAGVGHIDCDFAALDEELGALEARSDVETLVEATGNSRVSTPSNDPGLFPASDSATRRETRSGSDNVESVHDIGENARDKDMEWQREAQETVYKHDMEWQREAQEAAFKRILENAVNVARQRVRSGIFESTGIPHRDPVATSALPQETFREAFATRTPERDFKVGAAGELYMFEYLKGLDLPRFGLENWKSGIRDRVKIHADYRDLEKDNDRSAIADIEYLDYSHRFTQFLIQKGHLAQGLWDNERPLYHIEVKTTTSSDWQEPFFMSKAQERHVQDKHIEDDKSCSSIYMICRIFNLGKGDETGMHLYLDPETKRRNRELEFSTHTWAVKPLMHPTMLVGKAPSAKDVFGLNNDISSSNSSEVPSANGVFGMNNASSNSSRAPSTPSVFDFKWTNDISIFDFRRDKDVSNSNSSKASTTTNIFDGSSVPSASSSFGIKAASSNSETLRSASSTSSLAAAESLSPSATDGLLGTNPPLSNSKIPETTATCITPAAVQPSQSAFSFGGNAFNFTKPAFGSTSITKTASTTKSETSTSPSVLTSEDSAPMDRVFPKLFQDSHCCNRENPADISPSPSPAPSPKPRSPQA